MDIFVKYNKRRTMISLESKSNEDTEIVIEKFLITISVSLWLKV